jgi:hypothetical protein
MGGIPMYRRLAFFFLGIFTSVLCGCSHIARLYPVQGPLSAQTPSPVFFAKITDKPFVVGDPGPVYPGGISVVLRDGEVGKAHWERVVPIKPPTGGVAVDSSPTAPDIASAWDGVYGPGFYVSNVLGSPLHYRAIVSGNRGTVLSLEIWEPEPHRSFRDIHFVDSIKGVARDNRGNIFKLVL